MKLAVVFCGMLLSGCSQLATSSSDEMIAQVRGEQARLASVVKDVLSIDVLALREANDGNVLSLARLAGEYDADMRKIADAAVAIRQKGFRADVFPGPDETTLVVRFAKGEPSYALNLMWWYTSGKFEKFTWSWEIP